MGGLGGLEFRGFGFWVQGSGGCVAGVGCAYLGKTISYISSICPQNSLEALKPYSSKSETACPRTLQLVRTRSPDAPKIRIEQSR